MTARKVRILFIGNSFTTRNDVPALLAGLAANAEEGVSIESEIVAAGGASLRRHLNAGKAAELLKASAWDYVVLQEQSTLPVKNRLRTHENIRDFHELIRDFVRRQPDPRAEPIAGSHRSPRSHPGSPRVGRTVPGRSPR